MSPPDSPSSPVTTASTRTSWLTTAERGTMGGIRLVIWMATVFGRTPTRGFIRLIALWYALFDRPARAASQEWWTVIHGTAPSWWMVYRHIRQFAQTALDRIFFVQGQYAGFEVTRRGHHHLVQAQRNGRGAILLGAHLGSFEAMRAGASTSEVPVNILGHFENARMINALLERLNPRASARVIHISQQSIDFIFRVQERIEAGELVAILGDRTGLNEKTVVVEFFGRPARFPIGPLMLASVLHCPVLLTFGLYREPNRYELHCEPFADRIVVPRKNREAEIRDLIQRFAHRLEDYCRRAPDNWFNFYDFWEPTDAALPADPSLASGHSVDPPPPAG